MWGPGSTTTLENGVIGGRGVFSVVVNFNVMKKCADVVALFSQHHTPAQYALTMVHFRISNTLPTFLVTFIYFFYQHSIIL